MESIENEQIFCKKTLKMKWEWTRYSFKTILLLNIGQLLVSLDLQSQINLVDTFNSLVRA